MAVSLKERVAGHSDFFDRLVELIPARYYVPDEQNPEWSKFQKTKSAKAAAKQAAKENSKKALRAKLQPGNAMTSLEKMRLKEGAEGSDEDDEDDAKGSDEPESDNESDFEDDVEDDASDSADDSDTPPKKTVPRVPNGDKARAKLDPSADDASAARIENVPAAGAPPTAAGWSLGDGAGGDRLEELRLRLKAKIEASRVARKAEETAEKAAKAREWREKKKKTKAEKNAEKRKRRESEDAAGSKPGADSDSESDEPIRDKGADDKFDFGRVDMGDGVGGGAPKRKRAKKETLLARAVDQRRAVADAGGEETVAGQKVAEKFSWSAALARAGGEKVLDDPKLLSKSVKNEQKRKKKSQEKWEKREAFQKEQMADKQKKRKDNLKSRVKAKIERKIDKREKKRNRPGFEGRSQGPINK